MDAQKELDTRGLNCPLPILKTKKALADFQAFARQTGNELLEQTPVGDEFIHYLRRR
jgi:tRNA 2-thiouridine synthesizing protein A